MKKAILLLFAFFFCAEMTLHAQELPFLGKTRLPHVELGGDTVGGSDCWGWTGPDGTEYAIMGTYTGTSYVRASDLAVLDEVAGPSGGDSYFHRDMVTYQNYCYVVNTMTGSGTGMQIIDLSYLPDSVHLVTTITGTGSFWNQSHNMWIDTAMGYAYLVDHWYAGVRILDLTDPVSPVEVGFINAPQTHDMFVRNDTAWLAEGWNFAYSVWDVSVKTSPVMLTRITDPAFGYTHQIWPTDDGDYFITTEEEENKTVKIWDMTDLMNVTKVGEYLGTGNLAHNVHLEGDTMYVSHYEGGVRVVDITDKTSPVEIAWYDTYPARDSGEFYGCWGVYPHTENGMIFASNLDGWLYVLGRDSSLITDRDVSSIKIEHEVKIAPNPFSSNIQISLINERSTNANICILDNSGKELACHRNKWMPVGKYSFYLNEMFPELSAIPPGIYFLKISTATGDKIEKIVKY